MIKQIPVSWVIFILIVTVLMYFNNDVVRTVVVICTSTTNFSQYSYYGSGPPGDERRTGTLKAVGSIHSAV